MAEAALVLVLLSFALVTGFAPAQASARTWNVDRNGQFLQISYGSGRSFPQYATFKPVMLSAQADVKDAFTGTTVYGFPASGWIIQPPVTTRDFGLQGATASTPTIEVVMNRSLPVTGWATAASVGLWSATTSVVSSWSYTLTAESGTAL
jgi:hypothetical protein